MLQCHITKYYISRNHETLLESRKHTMLLKLINRWFTAKTSFLENYIVAGRPENVTDVERLTREYHYRTTQGML
jgi:hypothetical protein